MDDELVLPTLEQMSKMRFDCEFGLCYEQAQYWLKECGHSLIICHQVLEDSIGYQLIMRHGDGEAVLVVRVDASLDYYATEGSKWIQEVHAYQRGERPLIQVSTPLSAQ